MLDKKNEMCNKSNENARDSMKAFNRLKEGKKPIIIEDGLAKINTKHPDYKYWDHE